ncbi:hypothetical protein PZA11_001699 [Diplocarpon coronariae]
MADASSVAYTSDSRNLQSCQLSTHHPQVEGARPTLLSSLFPLLSSLFPRV